MDLWVDDDKSKPLIGYIVAQYNFFDTYYSDIRSILSFFGKKKGSMHLRF